MELNINTTQRAYDLARSAFPYPAYLLYLDVFTREFKYNKKLYKVDYIIIGDCIKASLIGLDELVYAKDCIYEYSDSLSLDDIVSKHTNEKKGDYIGLHLSDEDRLSKKKSYGVLRDMYISFREEPYKILYESHIVLKDCIVTKSITFGNGKKDIFQFKTTM